VHLPQQRFLSQEQDYSLADYRYNQAEPGLNRKLREGIF
jgi:hypothetical protein